MVWSTTASSSLVRVSRSTWSRRRVLNACDGAGGVVAAAVEAPVDPLLDAAAGRLEGRGHGQGGAGHDQAGVSAQELAEPQHHRGVAASQAAP